MPSSVREASVTADMYSELNNIDFDRHKHSSAAPQRVNGHPYSANYWGLSRAQCRDILFELRQMVKDGEWDYKASVYELVKKWVKPRTAGKGMGYALLLNSDDPLEINTMVSHAWAENAIEFLETIIRSTVDSDVLFICAFSLYQNEDDSGPSIEQQLGKTAEDSPFRSSLEFINDEGTRDWYTSLWYKNRWYAERAAALLYFSFLLALLLPSVLDGVVPTFMYSAVKTKVCLEGESMDTCQLYGHEWIWKPIWPLFRVCLPLAIVLLVLLLVLRITMYVFARFRGRMIVVPNRNEDLYSRLWCVYEIFIAKKLGVPIVLAQSMAKAGSESSRAAKCFNDADRERINKEIHQAYGDDGYDKIDKAIKEVRIGAHVSMAWYVFEYCFPLVFIGLAHYNLFDPDDCREEFWGDTLGLGLTVIGLMAVYFREFDSHDGFCPGCRLLVIVLVQLVIGAMCLVGRWLTEETKTECDGTFRAHAKMGLFLAFINGFFKAVASTLLVSGVFMIIVLLFTFLDRSPRAFARKWWQLLLFVIMLLIAGYLHTTEANPKPLPHWQSYNWYQMGPEIYSHCVFIFAVLFLPINAMWGAAIHWGFVIVWDSKQDAKYDDDSPETSDDGTESGSGSDVYL